jgi:hypothetical protein
MLIVSRIKDVMDVGGVVVEFSAIRHLGNHVFISEKALEARDQGEVCELVSWLTIRFESGFVTEGTRLLILISVSVRDARIWTAIVSSGLDSSENSHPPENDIFGVDMGFMTECEAYIVECTSGHVARHDEIECAHIVSIFGG